MVVLATSGLPAAVDGDASPSDAMTATTTPMTAVVRKFFVVIPDPLRRMSTG